MKKTYFFHDYGKMSLKILSFKRRLALLLRHAEEEEKNKKNVYLFRCHVEFA